MICETLTRLKFILKVPEGEKQQKGTEKLFEEIMADNLPNLGKKTGIQILEAQRVTTKRNPNIPQLKRREYLLIL